MHLYRSATSIPPTPGARVVAIGVFDGIHLGHRKIIQETLNLAKARGASSMVLTFEPMPREHLSPSNPPARLTSFRERFEVIRDLGIDELCCLRFGSVQQLPADHFIDSLLVGNLAASAIVVGDDFRFGADRQGTVEDLIEKSRFRDFDVRQISPVMMRGKRISSTAIRDALRRGEFAAAAEMLGRPYTIAGRVGRGLSLGRRLGFATANIELKRRVAPLDGIFAVRVRGIAAEPMPGVASLGIRPTIGGEEPLLEVHVFDFDGDLYGKRLTVEFVVRLRGEEKFSDLETMVRQMQADAEAARAALNL
jgi:riboflavin kinase/FMN adenylyltransferase